MAILWCAEASTCANRDRAVRELAPQAGVNVVYSARMSIAQPDYSAEMLAARNAGAEVVICVCEAPSFIRMIRSAKRQGWTPLFSATHSMNQEAIKAGGDDVEGVLAGATTVPYMTSPLLKPYVEAVARYAPGGALGGLGASTWAQGKLLERIAPQFSEPPTREDVLRGLYSLHGETLGGLIPPITFNEGPHTAVNLCIVPLRFQGGIFRPLNDDNNNFVCAPGWKPGT